VQLDLVGIRVVGVQHPNWLLGQDQPVRIADLQARGLRPGLVSLLRGNDVEAADHQAVAILARDRGAPQAHTLGGFSAHAGQSELLAWLELIAPTRPQVVLTHGEERTRTALARQIAMPFGIAAELPLLGDVVTVAGAESEELRVDSRELYDPSTLNFSL
jgi:hypothetical protein